MNTTRGHLLTVAVLVIAVLALGVATPTNAARPVLFSDSFDDGNDAGWTQINRYWHVTNGHYVIDGDYMPNSIGRNGYAVTHVGDTKWKNYVLQATFDNTNRNGYPQEVNEAEFLVRVITPPPFGTWWNGTGHGTFYAIAIWPRGTPDLGGGHPLPDGLVQISKMVNGQQVASAEREYSNAVVGINQITIEVTGHTIRVIVNGQDVLTWKDKDQPLTYGGIGVGAIWETEAWFDDIRVLKGGTAEK